MRKIKLEIEWYNDVQLALELEHVSQLVMDGHTNGDGWSITGSEEKEPEDPQKEVDRDNARSILPDDFNNY